MHFHELSVLVCRSGEATCAYVTASMAMENAPTADHLRDAIAEAVDEWALHSDAGNAALQASNYDFNVGDLSEHLREGFATLDSGMTTLDPDTLEYWLTHNQVVALKVEIISARTLSHGWMYDTWLFTRDKEDFEEAAEQRAYQDYKRCAD